MALVLQRLQTRVIGLDPRRLESRFVVPVDFDRKPHDRVFVSPQVNNLWAVVLLKPMSSLSSARVCSGRSLENAFSRPTARITV